MRIVFKLLLSIVLILLISFPVSLYFVYIIQPEPFWAELIMILGNIVFISMILSILLISSFREFVLECLLMPFKILGLFGEKYENRRIEKLRKKKYVFIKK